jgi:hypothetical protein
MKTPIRSLLACFMLLGFCASLPGQAVVLNSGDSFVFQFTTLPLIQITTTYQPAFVDIPYIGGTNDSFRVEFFENSVAQSPFYSNINQGQPGVSPNNDSQYIFNDPMHPWTDLQGVIRFTGLTGSVLLNQLTIQVYDSPNLYRETLPVQEPATSTLLLFGLAIFRLRSRQ